MLLGRIQTLFNAFFLEMSLYPLNLLECFTSTNMETHTHTRMLPCAHIHLCIFLLMPRIKRMFFPSIRVFVPSSIREGMLSDGFLPTGARNQLDEGEPGSAERCRRHKHTHCDTVRSQTEKCSYAYTRCAQTHTYRYTHTQTHTHKLQGLRECV